jgi:hypothetical protein
VLKPTRLALFALLILLAAPAATVHAAPKMPIGFFDDATFRWAAARANNLQQASNAGASIIHTTASWPGIAPRKPKSALNGNDPAYRLGDLDELVAQSGLHNLRVMIDITGVPKWANGGKKPNVMPKKLSDLTLFARMLATRYDGRHGHGSVSLYSVWNEPNLQLFLTPQFVGKKIVGPANYAKLYKSAYAGIKAANKLAKVAIGETSARGRDKPLRGKSATIAPGTFARLLSKVKGLKFDAWAHHPYPTSPNLPPTQKVRYPNVTFSTMPTFESNLKKFFHRTVPVWITEYGHETKPGEPHGVTTARQAAYAKQALTMAKNDPDIQMFIWFVFHDSRGNPWQSGLFGTRNNAKPAYRTFSAVAKLIDGSTTTVKAGSKPKIKVFVPLLGYYTAPGSQIDITYSVKDGSKNVAVASQPTASLGADFSVTFTGNFKTVKKHTYTITVNASEPNGHTDKALAAVKAV